MIVIHEIIKLSMSGLRKQRWKFCLTYTNDEGLTDVVLEAYSSYTRANKKVVWAPENVWYYKNKDNITFKKKDIPEVNNAFDSLRKHLIKNATTLKFRIG